MPFPFRVAHDNLRIKIDVFKPESLANPKIHISHPLAKGKSYEKNYGLFDCLFYLTPS